MICPHCSVGVKPGEATSKAGNDAKGNVKPAVLKKRKAALSDKLKKPDKK